jgi:predicted nucleic acid-binding protein
VTIGLDTSVVVRLLVGLPQTQFRAARKRLDVAHAEGRVVLVPDLVIAEAFHALTHHYQIPEDAIRTRMLEFLRSGLVQADPPGAEHALDAAGPAGVVDHLIHQRCRERRATLLTFDRRQARLEGADLV